MSLFAPTADQELLEETTRKFIEAECPITRVRDLAVDADGYEPTYWKQGAQLGWTALVVPEDAGGGRVSECGVLDLALVAYEFGRHAAPGPLVGTNVVAAALGRWGRDHQKAGPLAELLNGEAIGAWALAEPPPFDRLGHIDTRAVATDDGFRLDGVKAPIEIGTVAAHILVSARADTGLVQLLVPSTAPGLTIEPLTGVDITRRFARLRFDGVRVPESAIVGTMGHAGDAVAWLADLAVAVQLAEMCGAMRWAFDATVEWAFNRYSFGRPLASYQEIKHRFADMKMWLEASFAIAARAAEAVDRNTDDRSELVSAGKFYIGRYGVELMHDCVQIHGGIGVTFDHDLHLFLRRVVTDAALFGSPADHAIRLAEILDAKDRKA